MSGPIEHLPPGTELTEPESFQALPMNEASAPLGASLGARIRGERRAGAAPRPRVDAGRAIAATRRAAPKPQADPAPPSPSAAAALEAELDRCRSREHVPRLAAHLARAYASATACFVVREDVIEGECGLGLGEGVRADGTLVPATAPGIFAGVVSSGVPFRGAPPEGDLGRRVLRALGRSHVREILVLPILLRGRVVSLLYADNGPEMMSDASAAALAAVCQRVSRTYARLILERKRNSA